MEKDQAGRAEPATGAPVDVQDPRSVASALEAATPMLRDYIAHHLPPSMSRVIDPADVLQDTFLEAWRGATAFRPDGKPDAFDRWLLTIARCQIIEHVREWDAAWRGRDCSDAVVEALEQLAVDRRAPSQSFYSPEVRTAIKAALGRLPEDQETASGSAISKR